jgi:KaiC/GvpD/RAD55 family RecA-like ATPase
LAFYIEGKIILILSMLLLISKPPAVLRYYVVRVKNNLYYWQATYIFKRSDTEGELFFSNIKYQINAGHKRKCV